MRKLSLLFLGVAVAFIVVGATGDSSSTQTVLSTAVKASPTAGMRVAIDPATGEIVEPTAEALSSIPQGVARAVQPAPADLVEVPLKDGGVMIDLGGQFQNFSTVQIDANGNIVAPCITAESTTLTSAESADKE